MDNISKCFIKTMYKIANNKKMECNITILFELEQSSINAFTSTKLFFIKCLLWPLLTEIEKKNKKKMEKHFKSNRNNVIMIRK